MQGGVKGKGASPLAHTDSFYECSQSLLTKLANTLSRTLKSMGQIYFYVNLKKKIGLNMPKLARHLLQNMPASPLCIIKLQESYYTARLAQLFSFFGTCKAYIDFYLIT